ncbi:MAG TPA: ABC transporter ATP-binding protein [Candidatus Aquicultor sp.]|jgi:ABC-2 type transport system ATP-binding protein
MKNKPIIKTQSLTKKYGDFIALSNLDLEINHGDIFGLLGHNGAGKTTTVSILTTLLQPSDGVAEICGYDAATNSKEVCRRIGYLPENVEFYDALTLRENLAFFGKLSGVENTEKRISEVLEFLDFTGHENQKLEEFSKGMRQRAGIAQAILHKPEVLFLDEPTSGLDPQGVKLLRENIIHLNQEFGMTIFMNTHLLSEVTKTCTSIGILRNGELLYHNTLESTLQAFPGELSLEDIYLKVDARSE